MASDFRGQSNLPRGLRNNNPFNLRTPPAGWWLGQVGIDSGDFAIFSDVAWGLRAYLLNFKSSVTKHNTKTLRQYIYRFAPPSQNETEKYLATVVRDTGINPQEEMPTGQDTVASIMRSQIGIEIGQSYSSMITDDDIAEAFVHLDTPLLQSFFEASTIFISNNPKTSTALMIGFFTSIGLIWYGSYKYIQGIKK